MAWLTDWTYRKAIVIDQTDDLGADVAYQMKLLVGETSGAAGEQVDCNGHVAADFDDLRFTKSDGTTLLDYWIESLSGATPNQLATVWIETVLLDDAADTTIYMYYGNPGASAVDTSQHMGEATFLFFDHFEYVGAEAITDKWQGDTNHCAIASSIVTLTADGSSTHKIYPLGISTGDIAARMKAEVTDADYSGLCISNAALTQFLQIYHSGTSTNHSVWWTYNGTTNTISTQAIGFGAYHIYYLIRILTDTDTAKFFMDGTQVGSSSTTNVPTGDMYPMIFAYTNGVTVFADWVLIRKFTVTEPTWGSFGAEELSGWANITKINGIASASISKVDGIAVASISKVNGVAV